MLSGDELPADRLRLLMDTAEARALSERSFNKNNTRKKKNKNRTSPQVDSRGGAATLLKRRRRLNFTSTMRGDVRACFVSRAVGL